LAADFEGHLDRYTSTDVFPCLFCGHEDSSALSILLHLAKNHNFAVSNLRALSLLPNYLEHWRIHPPPIVDSRIYGFPMRTVDPNDPEEIKLCATLHQLRLDRVMAEFEFERTEPIADLKCLFCGQHFSGTWQAYLQWLFEVHQFNPGRPTNLVYIPEFVSILRGQLESLRCIHCSEVFQSAKQLRAHMMKKPHTKIPDRPIYDRYYMVNYLEPGKTWHEVQGESDGDDDGSLEEGLRDFADDVEFDATKCLVCDEIAPTPDECCAHMANFHQFQLDGVRKAVRGLGVSGEKLFYRMVGFVNFCRKSRAGGRCFVCGQKVAGDYAEHVEGHDRKCDPGLLRELEDEKYLIPVIPGDPLLTILEEAD
jgi:DNA-directed RNA polymerase subunit N (RpoN/RPB10)